MMKQAVIVLALVGLAFSAPQPRKLFHEHVEDFLDVISDEVIRDLEHLLEHYNEYDEFLASIEYMSTDNFKQLIYEMESLPEFKAVLDFLEKDNIDIYFFLDTFNKMIESIQLKRSVRHTTSGKDFTSFIRDCIDTFPKQKLAALYDQKMSDDEEFRTTMQNLESEEWEQIFGAFWNSPVFQAEAKTLAEYGIDVSIVLVEIKAVFGQN